MANAAPDSQKSAANEPPIDWAERYWQLWQSGPPPDLAAFVAQSQPLSPEKLSAILRVEQQERWRNGGDLSAESLLARFPAVAKNAEACIDLIYGEFLLRERLGRRQGVDEFVGRFPQHAATLREQIDLHRAIESARGASASGERGASHSLAEPDSPQSRTLRLEKNPPPAASRVNPLDLSATTRKGSDSPLPELPESFGRYRIIRRIGQGGMGAVYLAHDSQLERRVALKTPRLDPLGGESASRFRREARIAGALSHPNLCPVFDVGEHEGIHYLTMPYLEGETLKERISRDGAMNERAAARLCARIARALFVVHAAGVLHRDLKPANIMIDPRDEPIVMDFGLARRSSTGDGGETVSGVLLGTPFYSAPEQIGVDPDALEPACDVYALGVILYELLAGRPPFVGAVHEVLRHVLASKPSPIATFRPEVDTRLEAVCLQALNKDPKKRFASMADFAEALETYDQRKRPPRLSWLARRRMVIAAALLVSTIAGAVTWRMLAPKAEVPSPPLDDGFAADDRWRGTFRFLPPLGPMEGNAALEIASRNDDLFAGEYSTENGKYRWKITGTINDGQVSIELGEFQGATNPVSGVARIEGRVEGARLKATFRDGNSTAELDMHRVSGQE